METQGTVSLFCITFRKDAEFFAYMAKSYRKFVTGFCELVVACPHEDVDLFTGLVAGIPEARVVGYQEHAKGHLKHQVENDKAELYCRGNFVAHIDSDCLFIAPVDAKNFFVDGKPLMMMEKYEAIASHPDAGMRARLMWKACVVRSLGFEPEYEFMCAQPFIYPRTIYPLYRKAVEAHTKMEFEAHVLSGKPDFPYEYADYPSIGAFAYKIMPEAFFWVDVREPLPEAKWAISRPALAVTQFHNVRQYWSHGGVTPQIREEIETILEQKP